MRRHVVIRCAWDADVGVWYVEETDVPGLVTEATTLDALREKVPDMIRDLLADEVGLPDEIELDLIAYAHDRVRTAA
jgi:predicted RNase H-like HicB family nuclease